MTPGQSPTGSGSKPRRSPTRSAGTCTRTPGTSPDSTRLHPGPARDIHAHGAQAELARMRGLLPKEQDERVEQMLQTILRGGKIDHDAIRALIAECLRHANISRPRHRPPRGDLERDWERVEAIVQAIGRERGSD